MADFSHAQADEQNKRGGKAPLHEAVAEIDVNAGQKDKSKRYRQPQIHHVGFEHDPRQRQVSDRPDSEQRQAETVN